MKPYIYNIILGFLTLIVLILPFTGKVHDGRHKGLLKGFTKRGWIVCLVFLITIVVNVSKDIHADNIEIEKLKIAKIEKKKDDSTAAKRQNESNARIITTFVDALAKYDLKYDADEKTIQKLVRDSSKRQISIINKNPPEFNICNIEGINTSDTIILRFIFCSQQSTSYKIYLKAYSILDYKNNFSLLSNSKLFAGNQININMTSTIEQQYFGINVTSGDYIFTLFTGHFEDSSNKLYHFKDIQCYNIKAKVAGIPLEATSKFLSDFVHRKGLEF